MENWVKFGIEQMRQALEKWPLLQDRGAWLTGYHTGAAGALLWPDASEATQDGYAAGKGAQEESRESRRVISEKRSAAGSRGNQARWGIANAIANGSQELSQELSQMRSQTASQNIAQDKTRQDKTGEERTEQDCSPLEGRNAGTPATPRSKRKGESPEPQWAIDRRRENANKVKGARMRLGEARDILERGKRFQANGEAGIDIRALERAVRAIEIEIHGLGAEP